MVNQIFLKTFPGKRELLFCGDLTILLLGLIIYCLFKLKRKLRHSLRRPSRSDLVQFRFVDLFVIIFYHTDFKKSIHFHLIFGILGIVRAAACQILMCVTLPHTSIGSRVVLTVTFQKVDNAPDTKTCAQGHHESLAKHPTALLKIP